MIWLGPETRTALQILDADPRVTVAADASWLDAEGVSDQ